MPFGCVAFEAPLKMRFSSQENKGSSNAFRLCGL